MGRGFTIENVYSKDATPAARAGTGIYQCAG